MKRALAVMALGLLSACGSSGNSSDATASTLSLDLKSDLPKCTPANQSAVAYVKAEKALYTCQDENWELLSQPKTEVARMATISTTENTVVEKPAGFDIEAAKAQLEESKACYWNSKDGRSASHAVLVPREYVKAVGCEQWYSFDTDDEDYWFRAIGGIGEKVWVRHWGYKGHEDKYENGTSMEVVDFDEAFGPQKSE